MGGGEAGRRPRLVPGPGREWGRHRSSFRAPPAAGFRGDTGLAIAVGNRCGEGVDCGVGRAEFGLEPNRRWANDSITRSSARPRAQTWAVQGRPSEIQLLNVWAVVQKKE